MTKKEYLNQAYWLDRRIDSKLEQLSALKDMATRTTSVMSGEVVSHTRNVSSMQDVIVKIITMENEVNADIDRLVDLKAEIMRVIKAVESPEHQTLLELRYRSWYTWEQIADAMGYDVRHVYRLHGEALLRVRVPGSAGKLRESE